MKGFLHKFKCSTCGSKLEQDCDTKDSFAKWEIVDY